MANNRTLTSANAIIYLSVDTIYPTPFRLQGFTADDITDTDAVTPGQTTMGLDGRLSSGYTPYPVVQNYTLQADSQSNDTIEAIAEFEKLAAEKYVWTGTLYIPGTQRKYAMSRGFMTSYTPVPALKAMIQPRRFAVTWENVSPAAG